MPTHLEEYLAYYSTLNSPGYAVLVTGDWGIGKTYQVKNCIPETDRLYVSLFGVQTIEQMNSEVFAAAAPTMTKAKNMVAKAGEVISNMSGPWALAGAVPSVFNSIFKRNLDPAKILIFDDLERSKLVLKDVLGAINSYVEHLGFRVVVITHDDKLAKKFDKMKEKIFGQTIRVEPQIDQAFSVFLKEIKNPKARIFVTNHRIQINDIFQSSGNKSLRILRHVVEDVNRIYECLEEKHTNNVEAMNELVREFVAFDIEIRSADISEKDINDRNSFDAIFSHGSFSEKPDERNIVNINKKYISVNLEGGMLSNDVLISMLMEGIYRKEEIKKSIDNSSYFLIPGESPPWKIVISFDTMEDKVVEAAAGRMEEQFEKREIINAGEILHILCLRMMMAENRISDFTVDEVIKQNKKYIDDLLDAHRLPPSETDLQWYNEFDDHYDGYQYWIDDGTEVFFKEIRDYLSAAREKAFRETVPDIIETLMEKVRNDPEAFLEAVSPTNNGPNPYARIPLLHEVPAPEFVDAWLSSKPENWRHVSRAFQGRYEAGAMDQYFEQEKEWALEVLNELDRRSTAEKGFRAFRIKRVRPKFLIALAQASQNALVVSAIDGPTG